MNSADKIGVPAWSADLHIWVLWAHKQRWEAQSYKVSDILHK